jgi:hypothetical protein
MSLEQITKALSLLNIQFKAKLEIRVNCDGVGRVVHSDNGEPLIIFDTLDELYSMLSLGGI